MALALERGTRPSHVNALAAPSRGAWCAFGPLPDDVRASVQSSVNALYGDFVTAVAVNREITEKSVRGTEARVYGPDEAKEIGLVDGVIGYGDVLTAFAEHLRKPSIGYSAPTTVRNVSKLEAGPLPSLSAWRSAIIASPEIINRTSAAAELLTTQSHETMSIESARAFLRGLPTEQTQEETTMTTNTDPRAARIAEIAVSMNAFNLQNGGKAKASAPAPLASVDPTKLKRLAEIRLGALTMRIGRGETAVTNEQKKLTYALSVHAQTGMPLATVFTQLDVDTSKMLAYRGRHGPSL
jgi:hypothetical protein